VAWLRAIQTASGGLGTLSLAQALNVTFNGKPDAAMNYWVWYGLAGLLFLTAIVATALIARRERRERHAPSAARRIGYLGRGKASRANLSDARFSKELDVGAESEGEIDARRARFGDDLSEDDPEERPGA
jgi:hypothetical protein